MKCDNPFFECEGKSNKIAVDIVVNGRRYEICSDCWEKLADTEIEWSSESEKEDS